MIENLRKYTVLIIVLFVLVIIGFIMMDANTMQKSQGGVAYLKIADRTYTDRDIMKYGSSAYQVAESLVYTGDFQLYEFLMALSSSPNPKSDAAENFFTNRMLLRAAQEEFGIYPSDKEIDTVIRKMPAFTGQDGEFNQEGYAKYVKDGLGRYGLLEPDLRDLASDFIIYRELSEILRTGLTFDREMVAKQLTIDQQRINAKLAKIDAAPIKAGIKPTDDEIKTFWQTVQDAFRTEEKRKFTYFIVKPTPEPLPAEIAPLADNADDAARAQHATKVAERDVAVAEIQRKARLEVGKKVDDFLYKLETQENLEFKTLAQTDGFELKSTELVTRSAMPAELQVPIRSSSIPGTAADILFNLSVTADPLSKMTDCAIGENEWLVGYVDEIEASRVKTFDEAKEEATTQLINDKTNTELTKVANEANEKIKASLGEGKPFEEAAKSAGIESEILTLTEATQQTQLDATKYPTGFFEAAKLTTPGSLTEPIIQGDSAYIVLVEKREFVTNANTQQMIDAALGRQIDGARYATFSAWLEERHEQANVEQLNRR